MKRYPLTIALASMLLAASSAVAAAQDGSTRALDDGAAPATEAAAPTTEAAPAAAVPVVDDADAARDAAAAAARSAAVRAGARQASKWRVRTRHDTIISWAPRYRLDTSTNPVGLEQQLGQSVDPLPLYHRVSLDASLAVDEKTALGLHLSGWGSVDLIQVADGGRGAGDIAIGYVEFSHSPLATWVGRRFLGYGPPGGLHVDGVGAGVRSGFGLFFEAFVGRPVTPIRTGLMGPQPSFTDSTVAYGARVGYEDAGSLAVGASFAELWGHGIVGKRTVDFSASWNPGILQLEGSVKVDALDPGIMQARAVAMLSITHDLQVDVNYLHIEPARWIAAWSILSAFETSTFDEAMAGVTVRPTRTLAVRGEGAARFNTLQSTGEQTLGYRADLSARLTPGADNGPTFRVQASRRDDGVLGYTVVTAGAAVDVWRGTIVSLDGAFAADDDGERLSAIGRGSCDLEVLEDFRVGATLSLGTSPFAESELRAMLRARWVAEVAE